MTKRTRFFVGAVGAMLLATGMVSAGGNTGSGDTNYCMDFNIEPFHMIPGFTDESGACAVRDYWGGELQEVFYPFTKDAHRFNCEQFGDMMLIPPLGEVPTSVVSQGEITGTIGGHQFSATLYCASLTNWYQDSCLILDDPSTCTVQLAQPMLAQGLPYPRVTEVSVFDGKVTVDKCGEEIEIPLLMATRASGIMHVEDPTLPQVGASVSHSYLGMATYADDGYATEIAGSMDLLLQGHIFSPVSVEEDPGAAVIRGVVCSKRLYKLLNK